MAEAAVLPRVLVAYTNADWLEEPFQFFTGDVSAPEDFTGASAKCGLRRSDSTSNAADFGTDDGALTLTLPNELAITAPKAAMEGLAPGGYAFDLVITRASGQVEVLLTGKVEIVQGLAA